MYIFILIYYIFILLKIFIMYMYVYCCIKNIYIILLTSIICTQPQNRLTKANPSRVTS